MKARVCKGEQKVKQGENGVAGESKGETNMTQKHPLKIDKKKKERRIKWRHVYAEESKKFIKEKT